jgi:DNA-directed RNA polymerase, alpha subunit/40 kD subunit
MYYLISSDSIEELKISVRSTNGLHRMGIYNIEDLLSITEQELNNTKNLGKKSIQEINSIINLIKNGNEDYCYENEKSFEVNHKKIERPTFRGTDGILYYDISINKIGMSVRACNCLCNSGFQYASELIGLTIDKLYKIKNIGKKSSEEILRIIHTMTFDIATQINNDYRANMLYKVCQEFIDSIKEKSVDMHYGNFYTKLHYLLNEINNNYDDIDFDRFIQECSVIERIYEIDILKDAVKKHIIAFLKESTYGLDYSYLQSKLPANIKNTNVLHHIINEMLDNRLIDYTVNGYIQIKSKSVNEYTLILKTEKEKELFLGRLHGVTLEELGEKYGLTRERVRQIVAKIIKMKPKLKEDYYKEVFTKYDMSKEEFCFGFDEVETTYNYLMITYTKGSNNLEDLIDDIEFPIHFRKSAEKIVYRNYISAGDERIKCNRPELVNYVVRTYCREDTDFESFIEFYNMFIEDYNLEKNEKVILNNRTYENKLPESRNVLWKQWKKFRYYKIDDRDYDELLQTLSFDQYHDIEFSAYKFYRDYPELMSCYDIHDEYELHNLLKKIFKDMNNNYINFKRMPMIEFGNAERDNQVLDLLLKYAPVSNIDLATAYEEEYGVRTETVLANLLKSFDDYFYNGAYTIDAIPLPSNQLELMKQVLNQDFYMIDEVKRIYLREFSDGDAKLINPYTLKTMDFKVYAGYVIKNKYSSAVEFFRHILTSADIVDINEFSRALLSTVAFTSELSKLRKNYEIIEFSSMKYINIRRLTSAGITVQQLRDFCDSVAEHVEKGEYFTVHYLKSNEFTHELDYLGFEDCFYNSLLSEENEKFSYRRIGRTKVFVKGKYDITLRSFVEYIINREEQMDIYDFVELLESEYAVKTDKDKIVSVIKDSPLYYDPIMEKVYINYDVYFEEV